MALDTMVPVPAAGSDALARQRREDWLAMSSYPPAGHAYYMLFCMEWLVRRVVYNIKF